MPKAFVRFSFVLLAGLLSSLFLGLLPGPLSTPAQAQVPGGAQVEAQTRLVCGTGAVVSAVYLPGGLLQVTCQAASTQGTATASQLPTALGGTTLTTTTTAVIVTVLAVAAVVAGGDGSDTSTSSSSTNGFGSD